MADQRKRADDLMFEPEYMQEVDGLALGELRQKRDECEHREAELSYARRLIQGKLDILSFELKRRAAGEGGLDELIQKMPHILADDSHPPLSLRRHTRILMPKNSEERREIERVASRTMLARIDALSEAEISDILTKLDDVERRTSQERRRVQEIMDRLNAEMVRRYREGEADPAALLAT